MLSEPLGDIIIYEEAKGRFAEQNNIPQKH